MKRRAIGSAVIVGAVLSLHCVNDGIVELPGEPLLALGLATVAFSGQVDGGSLPSQSLIITNAGRGTLTGIALGSISYGTGASAWLTATLSSPIAPATLTLTASPAGLSAGNYIATVPITSSVASNSPLMVSVTFLVVAAPVPPRIALTPPAVTFTDTIGTADPPSREVIISNGGGGTLTGLAVGSIGYEVGSGWLAASLNSTTEPATLTLTASLAGLSAGSYTATVPITSGGASNSPQTIAVTFDVSAPPVIVLTPPSVTFTDTVGTADPPSQEVMISNGGGGTLTGLAVDSIGYEGGSGWLTASLSSTTAPTILTLTASLGLSAGSYTATVLITSSVASNTPQTVDVDFIVVPAPPVWEDGFESYSAGSWPSTWLADGNATAASENYVDPTVSIAGGQSLRLHGLLAGCWASLALRSVTVEPPFDIEVMVRNGNETLTGCNPQRAGLQLRECCSWTKAARMLALFKDGVLLSGSGNELAQFETMNWYTLRVKYERISESQVRVSYWSDGEFKASETLSVQAGEDVLGYLELAVWEGTAWFDNVRVLKGP